MNYADYLKVAELLQLQTPASAASGAPAHDEMLFIIVHQTYELWFKQILTELDRVDGVFADEVMDEAHLATALGSLERILSIQKLLIAQVDVLETMTPMDFLEFRGLLFPASGFQSGQFRLIETRLGLAREARIGFKTSPFDADLTDEEQAHLAAAEAGPSLLERLDRWLARTPFLIRQGTQHLGAAETAGFAFQKVYGETLDRMLAEDLEHIRANPSIEPAERARQEASVTGSRTLLDSILDEARYRAFREEGHWRMSREALQAALFINLYRDEPILQVPFKVLSTLMDIDEAMATWRYRHALMAYRMIGRKVGTGGSSGQDYLRRTAEEHRVFQDLFAIATFLIPRSHRPALPDDVRAGMHYAYRQGET